MEKNWKSEENPIWIGDGIMEQIKHPYYITRKGVFEQWMQMYKDFYEKHPDAVKWDYEEFIRKILDYYD